MFNGGVKRAEGMMAKAEEKGRAVTNPYAKEILDEYVLPLAAALKSELDMKRAGARQAHAQLLVTLDLETVALLAVRTALNTIFMGGTAPPSHRRLAYAIGTAIHQELVLAQIEHELPELYHTLARDFGRRMSKDERHRMTVFKMQAAKKGLLPTEWPVGARDQVGLYLLGLLEAAGMVEIEARSIKHGKDAPRHVVLAPELMERISQVKSYIAITMPVYGPCVAPPVDWTSMTEGGFHTRELRRTHSTLVRHRTARQSPYRDAQMPVVLEAVNALQRTAWAVNERLYSTVMEVAKYFTVGEVTSLNSLPKPDAPSWLSKEDDKETRATWPEERQAEFKKWKRQMAEWYTQRKLLATHYGRFYAASRAAEMFKAYPAIYFVYFADSRGRLYPMTYGLNPQGTDLQKALLHFSKGKPVNTPAAIKWFHVQGANKWGFDKATLAERQQWVVERQEQILAWADNPLDDRGWTEAGDPWQFLAWCFEYAAWVRDETGTFVSHLPISMDGSCNGLQNLSALFRDEIGGEATNLTDNAVMQDIYKRVAEAATKRLTEQTFEDPVLESIRLRWLEHGISRKVVKRSVMTTPYGVTKRSAIDYVVEDYLKKADETKHPFEPIEYMKAATVLMGAAWPAIGDVVVKGREAMDWLRKCARTIIRTAGEDEVAITWLTPSGFPACQTYFESEVHRVTSRMHGTTKIRVHTETDELDLNRHCNGLAPNFVHSMDASHLHLTTSQSARRGIDALAMIHDDYGTHAADAEELFTIIRETFVTMYEENDPVADFVARYPAVPAPPTMGKLDISEVRRSAYFFS